MHAVRPQHGAEAKPYLIAIDGERLGMSWQAVSWALKQRTGSATDKAVLLVVSEAAGAETGSCYLSHQTIAERAELSPRAVWSSVKRLEGRFLRRTRRADSRGHRTSDLLTLLMDDQVAPDASRSDLQVAPSAGRQVAQLAHDDTANSHFVQALVARGAEEPLPEPVNEPRERARYRRDVDFADKEGKPMSPTWEPPEDAYDFGASIGLTAREVELETAKFRDWHLARKTTALSADWPATWRLWMRRAAERKGDRTISAPPTPSDPKRWDGPREVLGFVAAAGVSEWYLATYVTWREVPERSLVTHSPTAFDKLRPCQRSLGDAGWTLRLERAA